MCQFGNKVLKARLSTFVEKKFLRSVKMLRVRSQQARAAIHKTKFCEAVIYVRLGD